MYSPVRRTTADLIAELQEAAVECTGAALVVGFDFNTEFVWASDPDALATLNSHAREGGSPIGIVTVDYSPDGGATSVRARPLAEYDGEEWVEKYLISVLAMVRRRAAESGTSSSPIIG
jgi:hypothetical protein